MRLIRLLYMSEHPPSPVGGAPLIARQHLRRYDQRALHILCDARLYRAARKSGTGALLSCGHTAITNFEPALLRPRRVFGPLFDVLNLARIPLIKRAARKIIDREGIEAIFTVPWRTDFAAAAYQLSRETGLPLYVFEMDDWHAMNQGPLVSSLTRRWHGRLVRQASRLWVISPQMGRRYRERFGVDSEFLFHFVDPDSYENATPREPARPDELRLVYTGAVNKMFLGSLEPIADWLNTGALLHGRRVILDLWGPWCPDHLIGDGVRWRGFVPSDEIPGILAGADALLIAITFSDDPAIRDLVRSSMYTKTVDYLASGKPVVIVSPPDTAEVEYFGPVAWTADRLDHDLFLSTLAAATASDRVAARTRAGIELVRGNLTAQTMGDRFLGAFAVDDIGSELPPRAAIRSA